MRLPAAIWEQHCQLCQNHATGSLTLRYHEGKLVRYEVAQSVKVQEYVKIPIDHGMLVTEEGAETHG